MRSWVQTQGSHAYRILCFIRSLDTRSLPQNLPNHLT